MLLYISIAGILISLISSYYNWKHNRISIYLTLLILIISIHGVSHSVLIEKAHPVLIALLFNNLSPFFFLPGAFLFFYVRGTLMDSARLKPIDLVHFIPFAIMVLNVFPYWITSLEHKLNIIDILMSDPQKVALLKLNWFVLPSVSLISRSLLIIFYTVATAFFLHKQLKLEKKGTPQAQNKVIVQWLVFLLFFVFIIGTTYFGVVINLFLNSISIQNSSNAFYSIYSYACAWAMLGLQLTLLAFPQILYGYPIVRNNEIIQKDIIQLPSEKYLSTIDIVAPEKLESLPESMSNDVEEPFLELSILLKDHLDKHKSFLNPDFSIDDLARELDVPRHHLYYCLNRVMKTKFTDLRKSFRIAHAKKLLEQGVSETISIEGIGFQSGFSSRSNFFNAFKSETGITPSEYLINHSQSKS